MKSDVAQTLTLAEARVWCELHPSCVAFAYRPSDGRWYPKMTRVESAAQPANDYSQKWEGQVWQWHYIFERAQIQGNATVECHTAVPGEPCWHHVQWAMTTGILKFPDWYPELNTTSSLQSFQCGIHQSHPSLCPRPCSSVCPRCYTAVSGESCWDAIEWAKTVGIFTNPDRYPGLNATSSMENFQCIIRKTEPNLCSAPCGFECPLNVTLPSPSNESSNCLTATPGASCWEEVRWAKTVGISQHPEWYPGLNASSSTESFQCIVYQSGSNKCSKPCIVECPPKPTSLTILHISDTHSMHRQTQLPPADIFIHSGDMADHGRDDEFGDFNAWLGSIKHQYRYMFVIPGNHDWWHANAIHQSQAAADPTGFIQQRLTNARVLHHEVVEVMGLKIWGAGWHPMSSDSASGNRYDDIPHGIDILVTHDPAFGIFDSTFGGHWGSSRALVEAVQRIRPKVHLFGHVHEQQGEWHKEHGEYTGLNLSSKSFLVARVRTQPKAVPQIWARDDHQRCYGKPSSRRPCIHRAMAANAPFRPIPSHPGAEARRGLALYFEAPLT